MSLKSLLTNFFKKPTPAPAPVEAPVVQEPVAVETPKEPKGKPGRPRKGPDVMPPKVDPKEAVKDLPQELIDNLKNYNSVRSQTNHKFTEDQQLELMEFIARYATMDEINAYFVSNYELTVSYGVIAQYKRTPKWKPVIKKLREKYLLDIDEVAGNHKRVRLERAEKIYQKAMSDGDLTTALKANKHGLEEKVAERKIEDGTPNVTYNQYLVMSDDELREELTKLTTNFKPKIVEVKNEGQS